MPSNKLTSIHHLSFYFTYSVKHLNKPANLPTTSFISLDNSLPSQTDLWNSFDALTKSLLPFESTKLASTSSASVVVDEGGVVGSSSLSGSAGLHSTATTTAATATTQSSSDAVTFRSASTREWLSQIKVLIEQSSVVASLLGGDTDALSVGASVAICLQDGLSLVAQLTSLAQLMLDPHYRTIAGFCALIEKEWLLFGHRFDFNAGQHSSGSSNRTSFYPYFLQFLDSVHQLLHQFPLSFEFNDFFLRFIAMHHQSNRFHNFKLDNEHDRLTVWLNTDLAKPEETLVKYYEHSIWTYINQQHQEWPVFFNFRYSPQQAEQVLRPVTNLASLQLWKEFYLQESLACASVYDLDYLCPSYRKLCERPYEPVLRQGFNNSHIEQIYAVLGLRENEEAIGWLQAWKQTQAAVDILDKPRQSASASSSANFAKLIRLPQINPYSATSSPFLSYSSPIVSDLPPGSTLLCGEVRRCPDPNSLLASIQTDPTYISSATVEDAINFHSINEFADQTSTTGGDLPSLNGGGVPTSRSIDQFRQQQSLDVDGYFSMIDGGDDEESRRGAQWKSNTTVACSSSSNEPSLCELELIKSAAVRDNQSNTLRLLAGGSTTLQDDNRSESGSIGSRNDLLASASFRSPHSFVPHSFITKPTTKCSVCRQLLILRGYGRCFICTKCSRFICHEKCASHAPSNCGQDSSSTSAAAKPPHFAFRYPASPATSRVKLANQAASSTPDLARVPDPLTSLASLGSSSSSTTYPDDGGADPGAPPPLLQGYLTKKSQLGQWKKRYFVLDTHRHQLRYYNTTDDLIQRGCIDLQDVVKVDLVKPTTSPQRHVPCVIFELDTTLRTYILESSSENEAKNWVERILDTIQ